MSSTRHYPGFFFGLILILLPVSVQAERVVVFAAASLQEVLHEIAGKYHHETGHKIVFSFASSGILANQIRRGAPAQLFISANEKWARWLAIHRAVQAKRPLFGNRLALITKKDQPRPIPLDGHLSDALGNSRLALGDFAHVPAGIYAKEALLNLRLWPLVENRLALTSHARATLLLVEQGEAIAGITYLSDAKQSRKIRLLEILPRESHSRIIYQAVLLQENHSAAAKGFFDKLLSSSVSSIYKNYGFDPIVQ